MPSPIYTRELEYTLALCFRPSPLRAACRRGGQRQGRGTGGGVGLDRAFPSSVLPGPIKPSIDRARRRASGPESSRQADSRKTSEDSDTRSRDCAPPTELVWPSPIPPRPVRDLGPFAGCRTKGMSKRVFPRRATINAGRSPAQRTANQRPAPQGRSGRSEESGKVRVRCLTPRSEAVL